MAVLLQATANPGVASWASNQDVAAGSVATDNNAAGNTNSTSVTTGTPAAASISGNIALTTGSTAGAGTSGSISLTTGTTVGGTRGGVAITSGDLIIIYNGTGSLVGANVTAGGAIAATGDLQIDTGDRTKNDAGVGVPGSGIATFSSGATNVTAAATGGTSGGVSIFSGATDSNNAGGTGGASGNVIVQSGNAASTLGTSGASGTVTIQSGDSADGNSGNVILTAGTAAGVRGNVQVTTRATTTDGVTAGTARVVGGRDSAIIADSTTITNGVGFQTFDVTRIIPADTLKSASTLRIFGSVRSTAINAAETKTVRVRIGGVVICTSTAVAAAVNDTCFFDCFVTTRAAAGAAVDTVGAGRIGWSTAGAAQPSGGMPDATNLATNGALTVDVQVDYSAAGGNSSFLEMLATDIL